MENPTMKHCRKLASSPIVLGTDVFGFVGAFGFVGVLGFIFAFLLLAPWSSSLAAQDQQDPWPAVFQDRTEVNVVNVDVVVTDRDGQPVTGLKPGDFVLLHNGEAVEISNFFAVEGGKPLTLVPVAAGAAEETAEVQEPASTAIEEAAPPAEDRTLSLILFVDDANIQPAGRKKAFNRLREFLLKELRPDTRVMLVSQDTEMKVRLPFTNVPHEVFAVLEEMEKESPVGPRFELEQRNLLRAMRDINVEAGIPSLGVKGDGDLSPGEMTEGVAMQADSLIPQLRSYAEQRMVHAKGTLRALRQFVDTAAGLPGSNKAVLYVSDGLPLRPGEAVYEAYSRRMEALGGSRYANPEGEAARDDLTQDFRDVVAHANASKVTFYSLYTAPQASDSRGSAADVAGAGGNFGTFDAGFERGEEAQAQASLRMIAEGTGGRFGATPASFQGVLQGVYTDFDNRYSLGFIAPRLPSGTLRAIEVKVPNHRDWTVRFRDTFREKSPDDITSSRVLSALALDSMENPLGISLVAQPEKKAEKGTYIVPLRIQVPLGKLVLVPGETVHQAQISMFVAARDSQGRTSAVVKHQCPIRIPNAEVLVALGRSATCGLQLQMRAGEQVVAVALRDELAAVESTARLALTVPGIGQAEGHPPGGEAR
jgi:VWFA-related protein